MRGVDLQVDRASVDSLVAAGNPGGLGLNLTADFGKVVETAASVMQELSELGLRCSSIGVVGSRFVIVAVFGI